MRARCLSKLGLTLFCCSSYSAKLQSTLSFLTELPEKIAYAMSRNLVGPWLYKGLSSELAGNSNTNHWAIIDFESKLYFLYHNGATNMAGGSFCRAVSID